MSHGSERKEKNCLNCNARVFGRYCHVCGQEMLNRKKQPGILLFIFFNDITHFEGKFSKAIRYLYSGPVFYQPSMPVAAAWVIWILCAVCFTSAFFFIVFFSVFKIDDSAVALSYAKLEQRFKDSDVNFDVNFVSGEISVGNRLLVISTEWINSMSSWSILFQAKAQKKDSTQVGDTVKKKKPPTLFDFNGSLNRLKYTILFRKVYLKMKGMVGFKHWWAEKQHTLSEYGKTPGLAFARISDVFLHKLPTIFLFNYPCLLSYFRCYTFRRRKQFNFVNHAIFSIYYYIFCSC